MIQSSFSGVWRSAGRGFLPWRQEWQASTMMSAIRWQSLTKPMAIDINQVAIDISLMAMIFTNNGFIIRMTPWLGRGTLLRCLLVSYLENQTLSKRRRATWKQDCGTWWEPWIFAQEMSRDMTREINSLTKSLSNVQMEGEKILSWKPTKNILQTTKGWISTKQSGRSCRSRELSWKQELRWFHFRDTFYLAG